MKKNILIFGIVFIILALSFVDKKKSYNNKCIIDTNSTTNELSNNNYSYTHISNFITESRPHTINKNLFYSVKKGQTRMNNKGVYMPMITQTQLSDAKRIDDLIPNYPSSWIQDYHSVQMDIVTKNKTIKTESTSNALTMKQRKLLIGTTTASDIIIRVNYYKMNYNTQQEIRRMNVTLNVVPEIEASYSEGYDKMITFLRENSLDEITSKSLLNWAQPTLSFVISKDGLPKTVKIIETSGNTEIDQLLFELIKTMPKWKPAKNARGINVEQEFIFSIGQDNC